MLSQHKNPKRNRNRRKRRRFDNSNDAKSENNVNQKSIERAISRFSQNPLPMGIPPQISPPPMEINIDWNTNSVPKNIQKRVGEIVCRPGEFGFLPEDRVQEIAEEIAEFPISLEQALSLRGALNQEKSVYSHHRLMRRSNELNRRYNSGESVISLSKRFDAPPVNTFRAILTGRGWSKNKIKESLKSPSRLNPRDLEEFEKAEDMDRVSAVNQTETQNAAGIFEEALFKYFGSIGVRFRRQEELWEEQSRDEGRAILTPDLLFLDDLRINGIPCAWIDAKHYFGADLKFPRKKTQKQVDRYVAEYGHGAIVYRHGFCQSLRLKGAILLDSNPLDLSDLEKFHEKIRGLD